MQLRPRLAPALAITCAAALGVAGCGGGGNSGGSNTNASTSGGNTTASSSGKNGGTITIASGTAPQSADPQNDFTTQGQELYSTVNTPLLVFKRAAGEAGTQLEPGLAQSMPKVSNNGLTYTFKLRPGIKYSDGTPIKASDFAYSLERAMKINWDAKSFLTRTIKGAEQFDSGKAKSISGVKTNDKAGTVTITLAQPYGPFEDIMALPGTAPVPKNVPMKPEPTKGVVGDGPYMWKTINAGREYDLVQNPHFDIPTVPKGHAHEIDYTVNSNVLANAQKVLQNQADVFDPGDTLPSSILSQVTSQASSRYKAVPTNSTFYFFLNVKTKPFNNIKAREAVLQGLDERALSRLDSGFLSPDCHLIPTGITPNQTSNCPHNPSGPPNLAKARQLVQQSGMKGTKVTVWGEDRSPRKQYVDYLTDMLNKIGFNAQEKIINSQVYFQTIGNQKTNPQIGFADWVQDYPHPSDFVQLFLTSSIQPQNSENYGYVSDPKVDSAYARLSKVPASQTQSVNQDWAKLDDYMVSQGYYAAYGHEKFPKFYSDRLNFNAGVYSVEYQTDLTSLQLK